MKIGQFIFLGFFTWRILLFTPVLIGLFILPYREGQEFTNILRRVNDDFLIKNSLLYTWANFDGVHYLDIAFRGYASEARFFPLFPLLILLSSIIISAGHITFESTFISGNLLSNLLTFGSIYIFYKLLRLDYSDKITKGAILYLLIFPTSFFLVSVYTESLFLFLLLLTFYFSQVGKWKLSILCGFFLALTRVVGLFIIPALIYEYIKQNDLLIKMNKISIKRLLIIFGITFLIPSGLILFSVFNYIKWGNFLYFLTAHSELGNSRSSTMIVFPLQTIYRYSKILRALSFHQYEWQIALLELVTFIFGSLMLYIAWKKKVRRSYIIFFVLAFLLPVLSGTFSGLPRYMLVLFPIFITLALLNNFIKVLYATISVSLLIWLLMLFSRGYFVA